MVEVQKDIVATRFMDKTNKRLQSHNLVKNPFYGGVTLVPNKDHSKETYLVNMDPVYPRFYLIGLAMMLPPLVFASFKFTYWIVPGVVVVLLDTLRTRAIMYLFLRMGIRKEGYKGKIKLLKHKDVLQDIVTNLL